MLRGGQGHTLACNFACNMYERIWVWLKVWLSWQYSQNHTATKATPLTTPKFVHIQIACARKLHASMWAAPVN